MELNELQEKIVTSEEEKIVVISAAASGKTACLTERVRFLVEKNIPKDKIVVITFTNAAADEMKKRLGECGEGVFIGTIHSYANYLLLSKGVDTGHALNNENFDLLFDLIEENLYCIKQVDHLLLDEAQDTDKVQFNFLLDIINPKNYFIIGDARQSIYSFRNARPDLFLELASKPGVVTYEMNKNYRNAREVLKFAKGILRNLEPNLQDTSIAMSPITGSVLQVEYSPSYIKKTIDTINRPYKDWFILTRTNDELEKVYKELSDLGVPCDTFKRAELTNAELNEKLEEDTVKVLTIHTSKGLERDFVVVLGARYYNDEERRIGYVAATRAKRLLLWTTRPKKIKKKHKIQEWG